MNEKQVRQQRMLRKTAFIAGFARSMYERADQLSAGSDGLRKLAAFSKQASFGKHASTNTLGLLALPIAALLAGRVAGRTGGSLYATGANMSPAGVKEREYNLAAAQARKMIQEIEAERSNKTIQEALKPGVGRNALLEWNA